MLPASGCNRIGVLDSGVGGLTVLSPLLDALPEAEFIYYADGAWCPYGPRSVEEVKRRIFFIVQGMRDSGCSMINRSIGNAGNPYERSFPASACPV